MIRRLALVLAFIALVAMVDAAGGKKVLAKAPAVPTCRSYTEKFSTKTKIVSHSKYNGNPKSANWVDMIGTGKTWSLNSKGLQMKLLKPSKSEMKKDADGPYNKYLGTGAAFNSTYQMQYGTLEVEMKAAHVGGAVTAFITMSKGGDEIDFEWVGTDWHEVQSNYFYHKHIVYGVNGGRHKVPGKSVSSEYHKYKIDWTPEYISWYVDGKKVRTLTKKSTLKDGVYRFPTQPSFIQLGLWDGSGSGGTADWANGPIQWNKVKNGQVNAFIKSIKIKCDPKYNKVIY